jgi:hypothetical protein
VFGWQFTEPPFGSWTWIQVLGRTIRRLSTWITKRQVQPRPGSRTRSAA